MISVTRIGECRTIDSIPENGNQYVKVRFQITIRYPAKPANPKLECQSGGFGWQRKMTIPKRWLILVAAFLLWSRFVFAAEHAKPAGRFEVRELQESGHRYVVYFPPGYSKDKRWPIILFLHGAGERGRDPMAPTYAGLGPLLRHSPELYPSVVVFPQCTSWDDRIYESWAPGSEAGTQAMQVLAEVERVESIDPAHRILTGWSMGAFGVNAWAVQEPSRWHSVLAVSGGYEGALPTSLGQRPYWLIHGAQDAVVSVERSRQLAKQLPGNGPSRYDEISSSGHEVWERVYSDSRVAHWMLDGGQPPQIDWSVPADAQSLPTQDDIAPFVPAATVSHALAMRIGNDALRMLSAGIPESVRPERLQGPLADIRETLTVDGESYQLALTGLTYAARLESCVLECRSNGEIEADLGVGLELRIQQASLTTNGFSALTGPFRIVIGHRRAVPLRVRIAPTVEAERLRLNHRDTRFPIPDDNWYVEMPPDIRIVGQKFTRHEIETGIVGGLYTRKTDVEEQVRSVIPPLLNKVEQRLNLDTSGELTRWLWPFPVYKPRLRWTAESISVDSRGMSVRLGAVIAANTPAANRPVRTADGRASLSTTEWQSRDLTLAVDPKLIEAVSEEFAISGVARVNVFDLPEPRFQSLADPQRLRAALHQLPADAKYRSVLALSGPFRYSGKTVLNYHNLQLTIPHAGLEVFSQPRGSSEWNLVAKFPITVEQSVGLHELPAEFGPPLLEVQWGKNPVVTLSPAAPHSDPSATSQLENELRAAWLAWAETHNRPQSPTEDFVLGNSRLRLNDMQLADDSLTVSLAPPPAMLWVRGDRALRYRLRQPGEPWGLPQSIPPNQALKIRNTDPVEWQEIGYWNELNTLSPGQVIEWNSETGVKTLFPGSSTTTPATAAESAR